MLKEMKAVKKAEMKEDWKKGEGKIGMKRSMKKEWKRFLQEEEGSGTVETILILVVLIGLVIIFKKQLVSLVNDIFARITQDAKSI